MAHFMKTNIQNYARVAKEAFRELDFYKNDIQKEKSEKNLYSTSYKDFLKSSKDFLEEHKPKRKDQAILINEVITRPKDLKEKDEVEFYALVQVLTAELLKARPAYMVIHNDEHTQHAHMAFYAFNEEKEKWDCKNMLNVNFLKKYHNELEKEIENHFGYHISILKDHKEEHLTFNEYKAEMRKSKYKEK